MPAETVVTKMIQENIRKIQTTVWLKNNGALKEAEIQLNRIDGKPDYVHMYVKTVPGTYVDCQRCCPDNCPSDLAAAFEHIPSLIGKDQEVLMESLLVQTTGKQSAFPSAYDPLPTAHELYVLVATAWHEVLAPEQSFSPPSKEADPAKCRQQELEKYLRPLLSQGVVGVQIWNAALEKVHHQQSLSFNNTNLTGMHLNGIHLTTRLEFKSSKFDGATLQDARMYCDLTKTSFVGANLENATICVIQASGANFTGAHLQGASLTGNFRNAIFKDADLTNSNLASTNLRGVDLTVCKSISGADFNEAMYDEKTKLPEHFPQWKTLVWKGKSPDPYKAHYKETAAKLSSVDLAGLIKHLEDLDQGRLKNALSMLKKDRFQLFSLVDADGVTGVVKSQTDDELFYSCRLSKDGTFACCTQKLNACGGLRGAVCKHILVLLIGLVKAGQLDATDAARWMLCSVVEKPVLDKELMSDVFLKYKGVESGQIDWRPTETLPEDYFAF